MTTNLRSRKSLVFAAILLVSVVYVLPLPVHADQSSAQVELNSARLRLADCYSAVRAAEVASANISELTNTLNSAGILFSRAELVYSAGDFGEAEVFAIQSQNLLSNFISNANSLETEATLRSDQDFLFNFVGSIVGLIAVVVGSAVVWILLKRKYGTDESAES